MQIQILIPPLPPWVNPLDPLFRAFVRSHREFWTSSEHTWNNAFPATKRGGGKYPTLCLYSTTRDASFSFL